MLLKMHEAYSLEPSGIEVLLFCGTKLRRCGSRRFDTNQLISFSKIQISKQNRGFAVLRQSGGNMEGKCVV
jgi:hypothetical protein